MQLEASARLNSDVITADSRWDTDPSLLSKKLVDAVKKVISVCDVKSITTEGYYGGAKILIKPKSTLEGTEDVGLDAKQLGAILKVANRADGMVMGVGPAKTISLVIVFNDE